MHAVQSSLVALAIVSSAAAAHLDVGRRHHNVSKRQDGKFTYYTPEAVACPGKSYGSRTVAISAKIWNNGAHCGDTVTITVDGKTGSGVVVDECMGCAPNQVDLSENFFQFFSGGPLLEVGEMHGSWNFGGSSGGGGGGDGGDNGDDNDDDEAAAKKAAADKKEKEEKEAKEASIASVASKSKASVASVASKSKASVVSVSKASVASVSKASVAAVASASVASVSKASVAAVASASAAAAQAEASIAAANAEATEAPVAVGAASSGLDSNSAPALRVAPTLIFGAVVGALFVAL